MHFPKVLEAHGCGPDRLREIFTAETPELLKEDASDEDKKNHEKACKDVAIRKKFEDRMWRRILDGVRANLKSASIWQAVDMAVDAAPILKESVPLLLWAQGKIKSDKLHSSLVSLSNAQEASRFFKQGEKEGEILVDLPRICEVNINIVRSYITRRLAAMDALWANLWPQFRYTARGQSSVSQLRGDVVTQKVDMMVDQYGIRRLGTQWRRDMLTYGQSVAFPRAAWDKKMGWRFKATNDGSTPKDTESYIIREGVEFVNPHRSRVFYDTSQPLGGINTDTGPSYIGYWDILRYGDFKNCDVGYYNTKDIFANDQWQNMVNEFPSFFGQYFDPCVLKYPDMKSDPAADNDRTKNVGRYASGQDDFGLLYTSYFEKINPKLEGIGNYDSDIWIRLAGAGTGTIIFAEFMPSLPAAFGGINVSDNRVVSQSMASELLPYQDQLTNIVSHMLQQLRSSYVQLWLIDSDSIDPKIREEIEKNAGNKNWWMDPHILTYSATKLKELGVQDPKAMVQLITINIENAVGNALTAMNQILNLADRLMVLSPNELGQPNPREVAAREVQEISTSVQAIYAFINEGPREQNAAVKQILYESLVTSGHPVVRVPVMRKYTLQTVKEAGFDVIDMEADDIGDYVPVKAPIEGKLDALIYDYYFDSRDGAERSLNSQGAQTLTQMLQMVTNVPGIAQKLGLDRLLDIVNAIIRMSGAPIDLQIEKNDGETDSIPLPQQQTPMSPNNPAQQPGPQMPPQAGQPAGLAPGAPAGGIPPALAQAITLLGQKQQVDEQRLQRIEQMLSVLAQNSGTSPGGPQVRPALAAASATPPAPTPNLTLAA